MVNYKLKILRNGEPVADYNTAINILNDFEGHYVGQPIAIVYLDEEQNRKLLLAIGKRDCENDQIAGRNHGPEFYEIINDIEEFIFQYESEFPLNTRITSDIGGVKAGTTLVSLLNETDNGDISRILDLMFFGSSVIHPTIVDPSIVAFTYNGETEITVSTLPDVNDFYKETDRGSVSYGKIGDIYVENVPFSGEVSTDIEILDINGNPLLEIPSAGDFIYRLYATFEDGEVTPMNSNNTVFCDPWEEQTMTKDIIVHVVQPLYTGIVDIDTVVYLQGSEMSMQEMIEYLISNEILHSFLSSNNYILKGNNEWGLITILSPSGCSCKYQGDTEVAQHFESYGTCIIDDITYNIYANVEGSNITEILDDLTYYSNDASYFYEISRKDE